MKRLSLIDHLETYSEAVYFGLLVASLASFERFPCSSDLAGLAERCTVGARWRAELGLAGRLGCGTDSCLLPEPDLLTRNFVGSSRLSVWLEGLAELAVAPLNPAYMSPEKPDCDLVCPGESRRLADTGGPRGGPATVLMMVC